MALTPAALARASPPALAQKVCAKPKRTKAPLKRKRCAQADPDAEARRSRRQRKQVAEVDPSKMSQLDLQLAGLEPRNKRRVRYVDPDAETDVDTDEDSEDEVRVRRRRKEWTFELASLPEETLAKLRKVDLLEGMRAFLETDKWHCEWFDRPASETNVSRVMRQLERLASGEGVQHPRSRRKGSCFMEGEALTLAHDMEQLYQEAWNFTDVHGRDLGNGWLLHHPIKKCYAFQQHLYTNGLVDYAVKKWGV